MGKHKNRTQSKIILEFMEKYPDLAKGFSKRDKPTVDALWQQLTESVNGAGPPQYEANGWKKKWIEWKSEIKRKLGHNKSESRATGGGPYAKYQLTATEEAIVRLCGMAQSVDGVSGISLDLNEDAEVSIEDEMPSTSSKRPLYADLPKSTPKRIRTESSSDRLKKFLDEDSKSKVELNKKLDALIDIQQQNASSLRRTYRAIEKGHESVASAVNDLKTGILKCKQEKIELMKKQLELETLKFEFEKNKKDF